LLGLFHEDRGDMFLRNVGWLTRRYILPTELLNFNILRSDSILSDFPTRILSSSVASTIRATCLAHLILLDQTTVMISAEECKLWSSSLYSFIHPPVTSSLWDPNILLSTPLSNTLTLYSFLRATDQISLSYKTRGKSICCIFYIFIVTHHILN
jgi:hypothetical protein